MGKHHFHIQRQGRETRLRNERIIFIFSVFRGILLRLIYNEKYGLINESMLDSKVGARKYMNIRNHIFVINAIIFEYTN